MIAVYLALIMIIIVALIGLALALLVHGWFMMRNRVPYVVLPDGAFEEVAAALGVRDEDVVYDLGCGDGRVILALRKYNTKARYLGVENDLVVWLLARRRLLGKARLVRGEISNTPLHDATRVYAYLGPQLMAELEPRFAAELPEGARVVSVQFPLPQRRPDEVIELSNSATHAAKLYIYNY